MLHIWIKEMKMILFSLISPYKFWEDRIPKVELTFNTAKWPVLKENVFTFLISVVFLNETDL